VLIPSVWHWFNRLNPADNTTLMNFIWNAVVWDFYALFDRNISGMFLDAAIIIYSYPVRNRKSLIGFFSL
jgi:hypothetical protein